MIDEVFKSEVKYQDHEDVLYHRTSQPTEDLILSRNQDLRNSPNIISDLGKKSGDTWGRQIASIPLIMYEKAKREGYELDAPGDHGQREMARFLQSEDGKLCLVR